MAEMVRHKILFPGRDCILVMALALGLGLVIIQCSSVLDEFEQLMITVQLTKRSLPVRIVFHKLLSSRF